MLFYWNILASLYNICNIISQAGLGCVRIVICVKCLVEWRMSLLVHVGHVGGLLCSPLTKHRVTWLFKDGDFGEEKNLKVLLKSFPMNGHVSRFRQS
jgi:hypothetical protein